MLGNVTLLAGFTAPSAVIGVFTNQLLNVAGVTVQLGLASVGNKVSELRGGGVGPHPVNPPTTSPAAAIRTVRPTFFRRGISILLRICICPIEEIVTGGT